MSRIMMLVKIGYVCVQITVGHLAMISVVNILLTQNTTYIRMYEALDQTSIQLWFMVDDFSEFLWY